MRGAPACCCACNVQISRACDAISFSLSPPNARLMLTTTPPTPGHARVALTHYGAGLRHSQFLRKRAARTRAGGRSQESPARCGRLSTDRSVATCAEQRRSMIRPRACRAGATARVGDGSPTLRTWRCVKGGGGRGWGPRSCMPRKNAPRSGGSARWHYTWTATTRAQGKSSCAQAVTARGRSARLSSGPLTRARGPWPLTVVALQQKILREPGLPQD